jgi:uncharacterized protein YjiS (DUF1127 family)
MIMAMRSARIQFHISSTESQLARRRALGLAIWFGDVVRSLATKFVLRRHLRRTLYELRSLDDRMLADIGITRSEVEKHYHVGVRVDHGVVIPSGSGTAKMSMLCALLLTKSRSIAESDPEQTRRAGR